jgi:hypothetical protein
MRLLMASVSVGQEAQFAVTDRVWALIADAARSHPAPGIGHHGAGRDEHRGDELGVGALADLR